MHHRPPRWKDASGAKSYTAFMAKQRGYPDRRGMGAQSDFIAEVFVPNERYRVRQQTMVDRLMATGVSTEQLATMFLVPFDLLSLEKPRKAVDD